jgi:hypothetical protein
MMNVPSNEGMEPSRASTMDTSRSEAVLVSWKTLHEYSSVCNACCITLPSFLFAEFEIDKSDFEAFSRQFKIAKISIKKIFKKSVYEHRDL